MTNYSVPALDEYGEKVLGVSWSRLYEFMKCQQKSAFHLDGQGAEVKDLRNFIHGTLADRAVRRWLEQDDEQKPGQMETYIDDLWDEYAVDSDEGKVFWRGDPVADKARVRHVAKTVVNKVEPFLLARVIPYDYEPELRFAFPMQIPDSHGFARTIKLNGGADIVVKRPDGKVFIYDLKATTNEHYITASNSPQLIVYQIALHSLLDTAYEDMTLAFLTPYTKVQYHELDVTSADRQAIMRQIIKFANFRWDHSDPKVTTDKNECYWCDCKAFCPLWATSMTAQDDGKHRVSLIDTAQSRQQAKENLNG